MITASVPHDPVSARVRSNPATFFTTRPPAEIARPTPSTASTPSTRSRGRPSRPAKGPAVAVATVAPTVPASSPQGNNGHHCPCAPVAASRSARVVAASTVMVRSAGVYATTPRSRSSASTSSARTGNPASNHVPWPWTRSDARRAAAPRTTSTTSSVLAGRCIVTLTRRPAAPHGSRPRRATLDRRAPGPPCRGSRVAADRTPPGVRTSRRGCRG